jgi:hypothetical protein
VEVAVEEPVWMRSQACRQAVEERPDLRHRPDRPGQRVLLERRELAAEERGVEGPGRQVGKLAPLERGQGFDGGSKHRAPEALGGPVEVLVPEVLAHRHQACSPKRARDRQPSIPPPTVHLFVARGLLLLGRLVGRVQRRDNRPPTRQRDPEEAPVRRVPGKLVQGSGVEAERFKRGTKTDHHTHGTPRPVEIERGSRRFPIA